MADPMYAATDWLAAYDRLRQQPMQQPQGAQWQAGGMPDWWWQEQRYRQSQTPGLIPQPQDAEALPLGDLADPVSQLAFVLSPHLLAGLKALGTQVAQPGPSLGLRGLGGGQRQRMFLGERGNLGPPPVGPQGEPLPESMVRGPGGGLQRLYHGTPHTFTDFEMRHADPQDWARGVFMTENPQIAGGYAGQINEMYPMTRPNIRPVYADIKKPFDLGQSAPRELVNQMIRAYDEVGAPLPRLRMTDMTNQQLYDAYARLLGADETAKVLQSAGYDGITHMGGGKGAGALPHQVYIAFSPEQVYPSFNVDALRPTGGAR